MATSYTRRINLYINGQQVTNDIASIRAEMNKTINTQARMTIGSREYVAQASKIRQLKTIIDQHRADIGQIEQKWSMRNIGRLFNDYFSMVTAFLASTVAMVMGIKQIIGTYNDFEERLDNLSALTGLAGKDLFELGEEAKRLSTSTLEAGIRVTQSATDIVDAFTKVGSARPELLQDKDALVAVTKEAIILADAAKIELQPAIEGLTMVMNQYNVSADQARRIINVLGAGSKEGAGEIPYLTVGFEKAGTTASLAGLSIETLAATLETLAPRFSQPEIAGRGLRGMLLRLQIGADDTNPAIVGFSTAIENLGKKMLTPQEKLKMFGLENINVANTLITNVQELKHYEKALTGTNVALEQAAINTDNNNSKLAQARNRLNVMSIELGEKLAPALTISTSGLSYFVKSLTITIDFISRNKAVILTLIYSLTAYAVAVKMASVYQGILNKLKGQSVIIGNMEVSLTLRSVIAGKLQALAYTAQFAAVSLYNAGVALLSGNLALASIQFRLFSASMMANPIGLFIGLITAAGTALYFYSGAMTAAQKAQVMLSDLNVDAKKRIVEEKLAIEELLATARNRNIAEDTRRQAVGEMHKLAPKTLGNLKLENIFTKQATDAINVYIKALEKKAFVQAASEKLIEIEKQLIDVTTGNGADVSFWQKTGNAMLSFGNAAVFSSRNVASALQNQTEKQKDLLLQKEKLVTIARKQKEEDANSGDSESGGADVILDLVRAKELEMELAEKMPRSTEAEIRARNKSIESIQKEIDRLNQLGTTKGAKSNDKDGSTAEKKAKEELKKKIDAATAEHEAKMALIKLNHLETKGSEDQFKADLLIEEIAFQQAKLDIFKKGSKEYEKAYSESLQLQVDAEKVVKDLLEKAEKELAGAKIDNLKEGIEKQKAIEENRWADELAGLKKQLLDKTDLKEQELALNDVVNKTIMEKTIAHDKAMGDLSKAADAQRSMEAALIREAKATTDEEDFAAQQDMARANYQQELIDANGNAARIAQAERSLSDQLIQIKLDELSKKQEIGDAVFSSANQLFSGLAELVGKETALGKALFLFQQAAAIGQVIFNTAIANAKAVAQFPLTLGMPWVAINTASAVGSIASIVAQSIASFTQPTGYASGGYTKGDRIYRAGEKGKEWIAPHWMVKDPVLGNIIAGLDQMRTNPVVLNPVAVKATAPPKPSRHDWQAAPRGEGFKNASNEGVGDSGFTGNTSNRNNNGIEVQLFKLNSLLETMKDWNPKLIIEEYERKKENWKKTTEGGLK